MDIANKLFALTWVFGVGAFLLAIAGGLADAVMDYDSRIPKVLFVAAGLSFIAGFVTVISGVMVA